MEPGRPAEAGETSGSNPLASARSPQLVPWGPPALCTDLSHRPALRAKTRCSRPPLGHPRVPQALPRAQRPRRALRGPAQLQNTLPAALPPLQDHLVTISTNFPSINHHPQVPGLYPACAILHLSAACAPPSWSLGSGPLPAPLGFTAATLEHGPPS